MSNASGAAAPARSLLPVCVAIEQLSAEIHPSSDDPTVVPHHLTSLQDLRSLATPYVTAAVVMLQTQEARAQQEEALQQLQDSQQQCQQLHQHLQQLQELLGEQQVSSPHARRPGQLPLRHID